jgi:tRNA dimethylallyltransferase
MASNTTTNFVEQKIIIITGPTATGKTECAIDLAVSFNGEIINCDSRQIYQYMNIGTAKPDRDQLKAVQHFMIDIVEPSVRFSSADYVTMADTCIQKIVSAGRIPFIVGGTGFYIKALLHGLAPIPPIDGKIRNSIREQQKIYGNDALYERLKQLDPEDALHIKKNDSYRLIRALEVFTATGRPLYEFMQQHRFSQTKYKYVYIVLYNHDKQHYHDIIDKRVDKMLVDGLIDEVKWLIQKGYGPDLPAMKTVGYGEIIDYLNKKTDLVTAVELIKRHTKAYAKRQVTWFKGIKDALWIDMDDRNYRLGEIIERFLYA